METTIKKTKWMAIILAVVTGIIALLGIILLFTQNSNAQGWEKTYGWNETEAYSIQQTTDNGYIVAGYIKIGSYSDMYLIKTNVNGDTLWTKILGGAPFFNYSVQQTTDGGYVLAGFTAISGNWDMYLVKTNANGDTLWTKTYGGDSLDIANSVQQTTDGGYILSGYTKSFGDGSYNMYLVKTNAIGDTLWTKIYGGSDSDEAYSVQQTTDGGYILAGYTHSFGAGYNDMYLIKTNAFGDTLWTKTYGGTSFDEANSVQQTNDGGYILAGYTESFGVGSKNMYLIKTNTSGDTLWTKTFGGTEWSDANSVQQTNDGGYIIAGYTESFGAGQRDMYLVKTNAIGDTLWTKTYGGTNYDEANSVQQTIDGGYIVAGYNSDINNDHHIYLVKTDSLGNTYTNIISGNIYDDMNGNCLADSLIDTPLSNVLVEATGPYGPFYATTDANGYYSMLVGIGSYSVNQIVPLYRIPCNVAPVVLNFTQAFDTLTADFVNTVIQNVQDLQVIVTPNSPARPGFDVDYVVTYKNIGTISMNGTVKFSHDPLYTYVSSIPTEDTYTNPIAEWNYSNLLPGESRNINITLNLSASAVLGNIVYAGGIIEPVVSDSTPVNNVDTAFSTIVGSWDPNMKEAVPTAGDGVNNMGQVSPSQTITYTIHFQNLGTDTAFRIVVMDTINTKMDFTSMNILAASHNYNCEAKGNGILEWTFNNIMLPDENTNEIKSHGFVKYSMTPKSTLPLGTIITNTADIYFDYNAPVKTNTTYHVIALPSAINEEYIDNSILTVFPNPATESVNIMLTGSSINDYKIVVVDVTGRKIKSLNNLSEKQCTINITDLLSGFYFIEINDNNGKTLAKQKLIVQ